MGKKSKIKLHTKGFNRLDVDERNDLLDSYNSFFDQMEKGKVVEIPEVEVVQKDVLENSSLAEDLSSIFGGDSGNISSQNLRFHMDSMVEDDEILDIVPTFEANEEEAETTYKKLKIEYDRDLSIINFSDPYLNYRSIRMCEFKSTKNENPGPVRCEDNYIYNRLSDLIMANSFPIMLIPVGAFFDMFLKINNGFKATTFFRIFKESDKTYVGVYAKDENFDKVFSDVCTMLNTQGKYVMREFVETILSIFEKNRIHEDEIFLMVKKYEDQEFDEVIVSYLYEQRTEFIGKNKDRIVEGKDILTNSDIKAVLDKLEEYGQLISSTYMEDVLEDIHSWLNPSSDETEEEDDTSTEEEEVMGDEIESSEEEEEEDDDMEEIDEEELANMINSSINETEDSDQVDSNYVFKPHRRN